MRRPVRCVAAKLNACFCFFRLVPPGAPGRCGRARQSKRAKGMRRSFSSILEPPSPYPHEQFVISLGSAKITSARSPDIPAPTRAGVFLSGPSALASVFKRRLRSQNLRVCPAKSCCHSVIVGVICWPTIAMGNFVPTVSRNGRLVIVR